MSSPRLNVVCIGECMIELTARDLRSIGSSPQGYGGDTLNTAAYMVPALGTHGTVHYLTALGTDTISDGMLNDWRNFGIGTSMVQRIEDRLPGLYLIETDSNGERRFLYWRRDSAATRLMDNSDAVEKAIDSADLVYLSGISLAILSDTHREQLLDLLIEHQRKGRIQLAFDPNYRPALWPNPDIARACFDHLAASVDFALPSNEDEALLLDEKFVPAEATASRWRKLGSREVIVTSEGPSAYISGRQHDPITVAGTLVDNPVDTTAAGDSFNAAYLASRLTGADPATSARQAHELAAGVVSAPGALVPALLATA